LTNDPPGVIRSNIVLEGGNCVRYGDKAIVTDFIYKNNYQYKRKVIVDRIEKLLQAQLIVVPHEPYELTGHIDGMVRWIDEKNVFVNRMLDLEFEDKLVSVLLKHGLNCHAFPCSYRKFKPIKRKDFYKKYPDADAFQPSPGYYINYLHVGNLILYPSFDMEDDVACEQLLQQHFPDCVVKGINCYELSLWGGLIHCVTMNYKGPLC
jgi:agmatine/peptidylarginine deiminase